jgi:serine/threonine protein phosphatase PrpC
LDSSTNTEPLSARVVVEARVPAPPMPAVGLQLGAVTPAEPAHETALPVTTPAPGVGPRSLPENGVKAPEPILFETGSAPSSAEALSASTVGTLESAREPRAVSPSPVAPPAAVLSGHLSEASLDNAQAFAVAHTQPPRDAYPATVVESPEVIEDDDIVDPSADIGSQEGTSLAELLSGEGDGFDELTDGEIEPAGFRPPSIPGISNEITRPIRGRSRSGEALLPNVLPPVAAPPESGRTNDAADALLEELGGHLSDKTVDLILPVAVTREAGGEQLADEQMTMEGAPFDEGTDITALPPITGTSLKGDNGTVIHLEETLGEQRGCVFYRARLDTEDQAFTAVWSTDARKEPSWTLLPDPRIVRPRARASLDGAAIRVFDRPKGNTVVDFLTQVDRPLPAMAAIELGIELAEILEGLHGAGLTLLDLDPSQIVIERGGRVRLYAIGGFYGPQDLPSHPPAVFAAPEVRRRYTYLMGAHSDVYAVALLVYALLARRAPIDVDTDPALITSPRVFRPECPLGIWPHLKPCLDPVPSRRVGHARGLRQALTRARTRLLAEAEAASAPKNLLLEAWAELHIGLGKARRGAPQQDRAIALTDESGTCGLYVVSDGVSRSKYGDGAFAADQIEIATAQRWAALDKAGPAAMMLTHPQRVDVLRQITRSAGKRISAEVNEKCAPVPNEPNQVMSATISAAYIVGGEATIVNLGDSRSYLVRDRTIERIGIDHDRATDALRMGLGFREAVDVKMGAALTRVVGRVVVDEEGRTHPDPFEPEAFRVQLLAGDRLVLCSDGIPDYAAGPGADQADAEQKILDVVLAFEDPARASYELVVLANRGGGYDNLSAIVIAMHPS